MFQLIVTRTTFMVPTLFAIWLGVFSLQIPSAWLLVAYAAYRAMRAGGLGESLGYTELRALDNLVIGGFVLVNGIYALLCRGVQASGITCLAILTGLFVSSNRSAYGRTNLLAKLVIAAAWAMLFYRMHSPSGWGCLHLINNVG